MTITIIDTVEQTWMGGRTIIFEAGGLRFEAITVDADFGFGHVSGTRVALPREVAAPFRSESLDTMAVVEAFVAARWPHAA